MGGKRKKSRKLQKSKPWLVPTNQKSKQQQKQQKLFFPQVFIRGLTTHFLLKNFVYLSYSCFYSKSFIRVLKILFIFFTQFYSLVFFFTLFLCEVATRFFAPKLLVFLIVLFFVALLLSLPFLDLLFVFPPVSQATKKKEKRKKIQTGKVQSCVFQRLRKHWWMMHRPLLPGFTTIFYLSKILIPNPFRVCFWSLFLVAFCFWWHVSKSKNENKATLFQDPKKNTYVLFFFYSPCFLQTHSFYTFFVPIVAFKHTFLYNIILLEKAFFLHKSIYSRLFYTILLLVFIQNQLLGNAFYKFYSKSFLVTQLVTQCVSKTHPLLVFFFFTPSVFAKSTLHFFLIGVFSTSP